MSEVKAESESPVDTTKPDPLIKLCDFCQSEIPFKATRCKYCSSQLSNKSSEENKGFTVVREEVAGELMTVVKISIVIKKQQVSQILRSYSNNSIFMDKEPCVSADELFIILPQLRQFVAGYANQPGGHPICDLVEFLEKEYEEQSKKYAEMLKSGIITFEALQFAFGRGTKFFGFEGDQMVGSEVKETKYQRGMLGSFFLVDGEVIKSNGDKFYTENHTFVVAQYKGLKKILDLPVRPMDDESLKYLETRGQKFNKIASGCSYMTYKGAMLWKEKFYRTSWKADGRVMIDGNSFNRMNPSYTEFNQSRNNLGVRAGTSRDNIEAIPDEYWYKTWPTVGGFSFTVKKWGEVIVEHTGDICFDELAFSRLVLPKEKKELIEALVIHTDNTFADIISGKGAGCIFLLHGPPGSGKTLTAEAISEMLHRPLYSVGVGELGTDTSTLEKKLRDILDVASVWNAVILIDEADIFLERRSEHDIQRNAMVGIFLRLLEYHQGILFLTTNRVRDFDEAFYSRISVGLKYPELDSEAREKVWSNFLEVAKITGMDSKDLAKFELNGRQIRNTIRLAQALSKNEGSKTVTRAHIDRTLNVTKQFRDDISAFNKVHEKLANPEALYEQHHVKE